LVHDFYLRIFNYAKPRGVKIVIYPHYGTWYPNIDAAWPLVEEIGDAMFGIAMSLHHERLSGASDTDISASFTKVGDRLAAVVISGQTRKIDYSKHPSISIVRPLNDSPYNLEPYIKMIKDSGFQGPVAFINYRIPVNHGLLPRQYLPPSMERWRSLCKKVGLFAHHLHAHRVRSMPA